MFVVIVITSMVFQSHAGSIEASTSLLLSSGLLLFQSHAGSIEAIGTPRTS